MESKIHYNIFEVNEKMNDDEQKKYARELDGLEQNVYRKLVDEQKGEIFFTTGYDDIMDYIHDDEVTVMVCQDEENKKIVAAAYIGLRKGFYTHNDLTKFFKFNQEYLQYSRSKYDPKQVISIEYETYMKIIEGYQYAKDLIVKELKITDLASHYKEEKEKGEMSERTQVREKVTRYIYDYFRDHPSGRVGLTELDRFYILKFSDLLNSEDNEIKAKCQKESDERKALFKEYEELMELFDPNDVILKDEKFEYLGRENYKKYFDANPFNTIIVDTYLVHPDYRKKGLAKIITFEALKVQIKKLLEKRTNLEELFFCSTIHKDNILSKKVLHSFGNFETIYIKRRIGANREVHFLKVLKSDLDKFLKDNEEKINLLKENIKKSENITIRNI